MMFCLIFVYQFGKKVKQEFGTFVQFDKIRQKK